MYGLGGRGVHKLPGPHDFQLKLVTGQVAVSAENQPPAHR